jgi:hypothetical protein
MHLGSHGRPRAAGGRLVAAALAAFALGAAETPLEPIDRALSRQGPALMKYVRARGYKNVGVLKFRVRRGADPMDWSAGPIDTGLATRLELALVLAEDLGHPVGVVRDATAVAAALPEANHLTAEGRKALFTGRYPLAWGGESVTPDAFLTGLAALDADRRAMTVSILAFDASGGPLQLVASFRASTDPPLLAEAGESFVVRGRSSKPRPPGEGEGGDRPGAYEAVESAAAFAAAPTANPLEDEVNPVSLTIEYDGHPIPLEVRGGRIRAREPKEHESVRFVIAKRYDGPERYGVVLLVNGVNTLFRERKPTERCSKWLLGPGRARLTVRGYQTHTGKAEAFEVLSQVESRDRAFSYSTEAGTVQLAVFPERKASPPDAPVAAVPPGVELDEDVAAINRGIFPETPPASLPALEAQLRFPGGRQVTRGIIREGGLIDAAVRPSDVEFTNEPIVSARIVYYALSGN